MGCATCRAIEAVLLAAKVPRPAAKALSRTRRVKQLDKKMKRGGKRVATAASRAMSKALRDANKKGRKKNGGYKKGWDQKRIMQTAHRQCKKAMKR